ncbi:MAG: nucleotidyl transferase AbiEii/AbiGii toxin family protein, partial [Eubacteriales bacterium]
MISKSSFTPEHIQSIQLKSKRDPSLIERVIFAFGLLEAVSRAGLPFVFKGGTCLMLLTDVPRRFSTDIDIVVAPDTPLEDYLKKAAEFWPFIRVEEQARKKISGIEKRHFKFIYNSPMMKSEFFILLDVVFEEIHYITLTQRNIQNELLVTEEPYVKVNMPNTNCLLGDKLTAFAPNTTGIPYKIDKELEIIKQLYDIATLVPIIDNFDEVKQTYKSVVVSELLYRNLDKKAEDVLKDTINTAICVAGKGRSKSEEYDLLAKGIRSIRNHILAEVFSQDSAVKCACITLYLAAAILSNKDELPKLKPLDYYTSQAITNLEYN